MFASEKLQVSNQKQIDDKLWELIDRILVDQYLNYGNFLVDF